MCLNYNVKDFEVDLGRQAGKETVIRQGDKWDGRKSGVVRLPNSALGEGVKKKKKLPGKADIGTKSHRESVY